MWVSELSSKFCIKMQFLNIFSLGGWVSPVMPNVDFFVVESDQQWGPWFGDLDHDNSLAALVG
jgi:hypothetical protein